MNSLLHKVCARGFAAGSSRNFSVTAANNRSHKCKVLVIGGGSGGCTMASKFARKLPKDSVIILEPSTSHYYQPLFTLVGAGVKRLRDTHRSARAVLPAAATWLQDAAHCIDPANNRVTTTNGDDIEYEYVIIAIGLQPDYNQIPGLQEALDDENSGVSTIFDAPYCEKTWADLQRFKGGDAIFTYPNSLIKCPGAPQKICYLADSFFTKMNVRSKANLMYNTALPVIFGVKKYADALLKVVERKQIQVNYLHVLTAVDADRREAVFSSPDGCSSGTFPFALLHVAPPMRTPPFLSTNKELTDAAGFLTVDKYTLQHTKFDNIFGIGDCTNTPNSKTAAAIAKQSYVVEHNLVSAMASERPGQRYNGYGACPLVTSYSTCILAEFLYDGVVHETFPFDQVQAHESRISYLMKKELFPFIYWHFMLKGYYHGPEFVRRIVNPFAKAVGK